MSEAGIPPESDAPRLPGSSADVSPASSPVASPTSPPASPPASSATSPQRYPTDFSHIFSAEPPRSHGAHRLMLPRKTDDAVSAGAGGALGDGVGHGGSGRRKLHRRRNRHRPVPLDWTALVVAVLLPPIGFVVGIVAILLSRHRVGWSSGVARAATLVAVALSLVLAAGAVVVNDIAQDAAAEAALVESSADFCAALDASPGTLQSDTFGWPAPGNTIPASIEAMRQYETLWATIAAAAPAGVKAGSDDVLARARSIIASVELSRTVDDDTNRALMRAAASRSGVLPWSAAYCRG